MKNIIAIITLGMSLGFISAVALSEEKDNIYSSMKIAEFKGDCLRMKGRLQYENDQWSCHAKEESEKGLKPIPIYFPKHK